jgi:phosphoenolpyruvate-protein phosphotransferase (PTS system enzyme I)
MTRGIVLSEGIAIGIIHKLESFNYKYSPVKIDESLCGSEVEKFHNAQSLAENQIKELQKKAEIEWGAEKAEVFEGYLEIILDEELEEEVVDLINIGTTADSAVYQLFQPQIEAMMNKEDKYLAERATDLQDIRDRLLKNILGIDTDTKIDSGSNLIICTEDLTPSQTAQLDMTRVKGVIVNKGGLSSHSAIMSRTLSLPLILLKKSVNELVDGETIIVDCIDGNIIENPTDELRTTYNTKISEYNNHKEYLKSLSGISAKTVDGKQFNLFANIGSSDELDQVIEFGAEGIGLFRTEFLFMEKKSAPTEENQFRVYKSLAEGMGDKPVIIRTFDFGGDKKIPYLDLPQEENPFLGQRSVRLYEKEFELFATQIRAIARAAAFGNLKIMYPLISSVEELKKINRLSEKAVLTLSDKNRVLFEKIEKGIMIETPSSAILAKHLIKYCDFFSIGSNDLTQYTVAVDRGNSEILELFNPFNPAIQELIQITVQAAHNAGKWAGLCGELAADVNGALILAGLGIDEMSMTASLIPKVKEVIRKVSYKNLQKLSTEILNFESSEQILDHINKFREKYNV